MAKKSVLTQKNRRQIKKELKIVQSGDLYKALHYVGDDPVKAEIEDVLEELLDPETYKLVLAVFNLSTGWRSDS